jgi:hypothetical protein
MGRLCPNKVGGGYSSAYLTANNIEANFPQETWFSAEFN